MIDYGAVLKKNGKIMNCEKFFMDMETAVGWTDNPRIKYEDCNCIDEYGYSDCQNCHRANRTFHSTPDLGEWYQLNSDCRGVVPVFSSAMGGNYFVYAGDRDFVIGFYKTHFAILLAGMEKKEVIWRDCNRFSFTIERGGVKIKVKALNDKKDAFYARFHYKGDLYEVVYGYGIDSNPCVWNKVKHIYTDKKTIRFVDHFWSTSKN